MYFVLNKCEKMPLKVRSPYRKIAVVEAETAPHAIDSRYCRIVSIWRRQHLGFNPRGNTAAQTAVRQAIAEAFGLNLAQKFGKGA